MVPVHQKFLSDLNATPAPVRFASEDLAFRTQLPLATADMHAMISASATGDKQSVVDATASYVNAMIPVVTDALNSVDPAVVHKESAQGIASCSQLLGKGVLYVCYTNTAALSH